VSQIYNFEKYTSKVFKMGHFLSLLDDERRKPGINIKNIFLGCYYGSAFRIRATSTIEDETQDGVLHKRIGSISDDTIGYGLDNLKVSSVQDGWYMISKIAKRNGMLRGSPFHDHIVGVFDGIETYKSYKRTCKRCLTRKIDTKEGKKVQYYHREVVLTLVGYDFPIPIGLEMMRKGEDEVSCALRLLKRVIKNLGVRFFDIAICDAIYCTPRFFKECENLGVIPGAVLKNNQEDLLESAKSQIKLTAPVIEKTSKVEKFKLWDLKEVYWYTADKDVRVIWAEREVWEIDEESKDKSYHWAKRKKVFAFSKKIDHLPTDVVYSIGNHRWDIDAKAFMDMVKHWHLKHKTLHFDRAYENMLSIRLISYTLFMFFFFRHINSRRKNKIEKYITMARMLYRSACVHLEAKFILVK